MKDPGNHVKGYKRVLHEQQRAKFGVSKYDAWGLDSHLSFVLVNGLTELRSNLHGWPANLSGREEWEAILDTMIADFTKDVEEFEYTPEVGLELLAKHYNNLWD